MAPAASTIGEQGTGATRCARNGQSAYLKSRKLTHPRFAMFACLRRPFDARIGIGTADDCIKQSAHHAKRGESKDSGKGNCDQHFYFQFVLHSLVDSLWIVR